MRFACGRIAVTNARIRYTRTALLTFQPFRAFKDVGVLSAAVIAYLTHEGLEIMAYKFDEHDASDLSRIIRRRRPGWNHNGIMGQLQQAAERGASLGQVTAAAERTWMNPKAKTPAALLWPEHWEEAKGKALNMSGERLCAGCNPARKHPIQDMTEVTSGVWMCGDCA